jgi:hypothetical protein
MIHTSLTPAPTAALSLSGAMSSELYETIGASEHRRMSSGLAMRERVRCRIGRFSRSVSCCLVFAFSSSSQCMDSKKAQISIPRCLSRPDLALACPCTLPLEGPDKWTHKGQAMPPLLELSQAPVSGADLTTTRQGINQLPIVPDKRDNKQRLLDFHFATECISISPPLLLCGPAAAAAALVVAR